MARFRFRLQSVLSYREQIADALQLELARAQERRAAAERELAEAVECRREQAVTLRALLSPGATLDLDAVQQAQRALDGLEQVIATRQGAVDACRRAEEEQRQRVVAAMQDQKSLEHLRERQAEGYRLDLDRAETKLHDESALQRFTRQRRQPGPEDSSLP